MVRATGLEPVSHRHRILSPTRLPVSPRPPDTIDKNNPRCRGAPRVVPLTRYDQEGDLIVGEIRKSEALGPTDFVALNDGDSPFF